MGRECDLNGVIKILVEVESTEEIFSGAGVSKYLTTGGILPLSPCKENPGHCSGVTIVKFKLTSTSWGAAQKK